MQAARALAFLIVARLALAAVPYSFVRTLVACTRPRRRGGPLLTPPDCDRAIARAAHVLPSTRCLAQAVAAECLLRREGHHAALMLGARFNDQGGLVAHAWVESSGITIGGGLDAAGYAPLSPPRMP